MLEFQADEIEKAALQPGEEEALRQEKAVQANAGRLASSRSEAYALLYEDEDAALDAARRRSTGGSRSWPRIDPRFAPVRRGRARAVRAQLEDLALFLRDYREAPRR